MAEKATFISRAKNKVIGAVSTVLAAPSVYRSQVKQGKNDQDADTLALANRTKDVSIRGMDYNDPIFRSRVSAPVIKMDRMAMAKK